MILIIVTLMLAGCSGMTTLQTEDNKERKVPKWYVDHAETGNEGVYGFSNAYIYAVAADVSPSMEMAIRKATLKAKAKLADKVSGELTNRTTYKYEEFGDPGNPSGNAMTQDIYVNLITKSVLKNYELEEREIIFNPTMQNYRVFVLVKITKEMLDEVASSYTLQKSQKQVTVSTQSFDDIAASVLTQ